MRPHRKQGQNRTIQIRKNKNTMEPFYLTTPIYYVNASPHLGHAYTTIVADVACRYQAMCGKVPFLLTGTDEHGDKIMKAAEAQGVSPKAYADTISAQFKALWPDLNIRHNHFIRTTDPAHKAVVEHLLQTIYDAGDIYFSEYEGLYCYGCERFYTERELVDGLCPDHETPPEAIKEANYFFKMSKYQQWLIDYITDHPDFIRPERYKNEILSFLKEPLDDLCISRPKSRLDWGITLPFDTGYVTYVWFDALTNYISALGYPDGEAYKKYWPVAQHVVAKDIIKPHGIFWPIMLKAAGIPLYNHLNVHGFWRVEESKMSKSLGNVVSPLALKEIYGVDAFRYFLCREMSFGLDANFSEDALVDRINADLANDIGNLMSRVLAMTKKYFNAVVPDADSSALPENATDLQSLAAATVATYETHMAAFHFSKALTAVWELIGAMNKFVDHTAPWTLAKNPDNRKSLEAVIYSLLEGLRVTAGLIYPVMPETASTMMKKIGLGEDETNFAIRNLKQWGGLRAGTELAPSAALFPRVEKPQTGTTGDTADGSGQKPADAETQAAALPLQPEIDINAFAGVDLRVGRVLHAEQIPKAKKLLKLEVDIGEKRTVVAGIAASYAPETLVGKQVIVVANLKPAKLMGVTSHGMVLAAVDDNATAVATLDGEVAPGTRVK